MTVYIPPDIADAIEQSNDRLRQVFESMSDEEKAEVIEKVRAEVERRILYGSGEAEGLQGGLK